MNQVYFKAILVVFFEIKDAITVNWLPNEVSVNKHFYSYVPETSQIFF